MLLLTPIAFGKKKKKNSGDIKGGCFSLNILLGEFYAF